MKNIFVVLSVAAGFGAGFGSGFFAVKKKYEKRADAEVASVKAAFQKHMDEMSKDGKLKDIPPTRRGQSKKKKEVPSESDFRSEPLPTDPDPACLDKYKDYSAPYRSTSEKKKTSNKERQRKLEPYVISPDEYMSSEYTAKTLVYYADRVLAFSDDDARIDNPALVVGGEALTAFGRYEDDSVYVRDDNLKVDYEIIRSEKDYSDVVKFEGSPKQALQNGDDSE